MTGHVNHWLIKSEPGMYSWDDLVREGRARWDGVRNFEARNNLRAMKRGDLALYYHTGDDKEIVGIVRIAREAYPDPTAKEGDWSCVDVVPHGKLKRPVPLSELRADSRLADFALLRRGRLSVVPVKTGELARILELGQTKR